MSRWPADARERLERAAIELFQTQGFAATTVPQITARAGLTTRTFHRHFADKREVLFAGAEGAPMAAQMIASAPAGQAPLETIMTGLRFVVAARFDGHRDDLRVRREIVRSDPGLAERDLRKWSDLSAAVREGFTLRGLPPMRAALLAETCATVLRLSVDQWLNEDGDELIDIIESGFATLRDSLEK